MIMIFNDNDIQSRHVYMQTHSGIRVAWHNLQQNISIPRYSGTWIWTGEIGQHRASQNASGGAIWGGWEVRNLQMKLRSFEIFVADLGEDATVSKIDELRSKVNSYSF